MKINYLMLSVSGARGIVGEGITPISVGWLAAHFGTRFPGTIVVGRDSRISGKMLSRTVIAALQGVGCQVIDLGIVPTPTVLLMVEKFEAQGGLAITASHNPQEWNALKFISSRGTFLYPEEISPFLENLDAEPHFVDCESLGAYSYYQNAIQNHIDAILNLPIVDVDLIRSRNFRVAIDTTNGAGGPIMTTLLGYLGCETFAIHQETDGHFPHNPEPKPENLQELSKLIIDNYADIGFACDPDVDRLVVADESGLVLSEELTIALIADLIFSKTESGDAAVNLSTSSYIDILAQKYNRKVWRAPVGEVNVARMAQERQCVIAGEGNGGVIYPELHFTRDAPLALVLMLQRLAETDQTIAEIANTLPPLQMVKHKMSIENIDFDQVTTRLLNAYKHCSINQEDGLRIATENWWIHIRKSGTEPILRLICEAASTQEAQTKIEQFEQIIKEN